ncbi:MAG: isoaspartyl peptidase/L-asparaginase [Candidatus Thermoplasmatota archaeon]|nr:isoaspartyl peptidase/L-asparaginase [Candidatus Thermoplasmatota archaeon]MBS3790771.1 isoaspartyl peptidase/L-asparaginase [Candidatus Thermoplasmatota archaeon]
MILIAHGGVGSPRERDEQVMKAVEKGYEEGMSALEAVIAVVEELENDPTFNAGRGSRLRLDGSVQMDAAVQSEHNIGSVAAIEEVKNPIRIAEIVHDSPYLLLVGDSATKLGKKRGFESKDLKTEDRIDELEEMREKLGTEEKLKDYKKFYDEMQGGTVGCVAYEDGEAAAAVSTGGTSYSIRGRVGDSPLIGSGFYVGEHGAVVATGKGEEITKRLSSKRCHDMIGEYGLERGCEIVVEEFPEEHTLGLIAANKEGCVSADNRQMARASIEE